MIRILTPDDTQDNVPITARHWKAEWPDHYVAMCSLMCHAEPHTSLIEALHAWPNLEEQCRHLPS